MLAYILLVIMFIVVAMMWNEGLWTGALNLINVVFSGIVASVCFEPLADYLEKNMASFTYVLDYLSFWFLFIMAFNIFRAVTDGISKHKVRFRKPVEIGGGILMPVLTAWVMVCIFCAALHLAPLARSPLKGSFADKPMSACFFGFSPDHYWWAFIHSRSKRALSRGQVFDPEGKLILKYGQRRYNLQQYNQAEDGAVLVDKSARR